MKGQVLKAPEVLEAGGLRVEILGCGVRATLGNLMIQNLQPSIKARVKQLFRWFEERRITQRELEDVVMEGLIDESELRNLTGAA